MSNLSYHVNTPEKKWLECHVEIIGVLEFKNEICSDIVLKITSILGMGIKTKNTFCIPSKFTDKPRKISACFNSVE